MATVKQTATVWALVALMSALTASAKGLIPEAVSPGTSAGTVIGEVCPTFSWGAADGAEAYELVVYALKEDGEVLEQALAERISGAATSWTPALESCLAPGGRFAWAVRSITTDGAGDWSEARLFQVAGTQRPREPEEAPTVMPAAQATEDTGERTPASPELDSASASAAADPPTTALATTMMEVDGNIDAVSYSGSGEGLTNLDPTQLSGAVALDKGGTGATDAASARTSLGAAAQADYTTHAGDANAHHEPTVDTDTTCNGAACDGTNFTNLQWTNIASRPAGLDDGDDDTTYAAGTGLALVGNVFSVTSSPPSFVPMDNTISVVDSTSSDNVGRYSSITLGADGLPVISYNDWNNSHLMLAKCNDAACSGGDETLSIVDDDADFGGGKNTSITLGADGFPIIAYQDTYPGTHLKVAKCNDPACAGGDETITTIDSGLSVGNSTSIALGADGLPIISYYSGAITPGGVRVVKCNDAACTGGDETISTLSTEESSYQAIAVGADGLPVIVYKDQFHGGSPFVPVVLVAKCNDAACSGGDETHSVIETGDYNVNEPGVFPSITLGADGLPLISYGDGYTEALRVVKCNDHACSGGDETVSTVHAAGGWYTSITVGADGLPMVSGQDITNDDILFVKCNDWACSGADELVTIVDPDGGADISMTIGADGLPVFSYHSSSPGYDLKAAHCGSEFCLPYFRRR